MRLRASSPSICAYSLYLSPILVIAIIIHVAMLFTSEIRQEFAKYEVELMLHPCPKQ